MLPNLSNYESEEQQVEAIKGWWKENGLSIFLGAFLGLAIVFGWQGWVKFRDQRNEAAAAAFSQLLKTAEAKPVKPEAVSEQSAQLVKDYGSTSFASLAQMVTARVLVEAGKLSEAKGILAEVVQQAPDPALREVAVLRKARVLLQENNAAEALQWLEQQPKAEGFNAERSVILGDAASLQGDFAKARAAYEAALAGQVSNRALVQFKLDNLPLAKPGT
ncbi:Ancillary SecYEG translocon subunit [Gammaproteobacteria bacterium]